MITLMLLAGTAFTIMDFNILDAAKDWRIAHRGMFAMLFILSISFDVALISMIKAQK